MNMLQKLLLKRYKAYNGKTYYANRHILTLTPKWAKRLKWVLRYILRQKVLFRGRGNRVKYVGLVNAYGYKYSAHNLRQSLPLKFAEKYAIYITTK